MKKEMFALMILFAVSCFFIVSASAQEVPQISINEFEADSTGADSGKEWVEVYNAEDHEINVSGWTLYDGLGAAAPNLVFTFPDETFLEAGEFYVADLSGSDLNNNGGESVVLKNDLNVTVDETPVKVDSLNNDLTWQRIPDGGDLWILQEETGGITNYIPGEILNEEVSPVCAFENDAITFTAEVLNSCGGEVIFTIENEGTWLNFTAELEGNEYSVTLSNGTLAAPQDIDWKVLAEDCAGVLIEGDTQSFTLNSLSNLTIVPGLPDGLNDWFVTEPIFTIQNPSAQEIHYRWNGEFFSEIGSFVSFGLEGTPNNGQITGGIFTLRYKSSVDCGMEDEQEFVGRFDLTSPVITDIFPEENSTIEEGEVEISALIDELYAQNSGVDEESIQMYVDGVLEEADVRNSGSLDKIVELELDLGAGEHEVKIIAADNAGRISERTWTFLIEGGTAELDLEVYSPQNEIYDERKVQFNLSVSEEVEEIVYVDNSENRPRERVLCKNCESYGFDKAKFKNFKDGENNVTFIARDGGRETQAEITFIVDSKAPAIGKTSPTRGFANGVFDLEFREANPEKLMFVIGNAESGFTEEMVNMTEICESAGEEYECSVEVNLSEFDGEEVSYFFELTDITNKTDKSRERELGVDVTKPEFSFVNYTVDRRKVQFEIGVNETNFDEITYTDLAEGKEKRLCSKLSDGVCKTTKSFRPGEYNMTLTAYDDAGNFDEEEISFVVLG